MGRLIGLTCFLFSWGHCYSLVNAHGFGELPSYVLRPYFPDFLSFSRSRQEDGSFSHYFMKAVSGSLCRSAGMFSLSFSNSLSMQPRLALNSPSPCLDPLCAEMILLHLHIQAGGIVLKFSVV